MKKIFIAIFLLIYSPSLVFAEEKPLPRILLALYDSRLDESPRTTMVHNFLEMPANHLGYDIHYHDIMSPLPPLDDTIAGIILWETEIRDSYNYLLWLKNAASLHKKLILIEDSTSISDSKDPKLLQLWNNILGYIGVQDDTNWLQLTYDARIAHIDPEMMDFERKITPPFPSVTGFHALPGSEAVSHLRMRANNRMEDSNFDMVITSPNGGLIAPGYAIYQSVNLKNNKARVFRQWFINPFLFLQKALNTGIIPVPDTTTMNGKRIFYSHIDGDGWNNLSEIERYVNTNTISADVIFQEILQPYSDFGFSVGLISADVQKDCAATLTSESVARKIFSLPNVEPASHTYSHPLYWDFFKDYTPEKEQPLLKYYPPRGEQKFSALTILEKKLLNADVISSHYDSSSAQKIKLSPLTNAPYKRKTEEEILKDCEYMPRSYVCAPFNLKQEISGALAIAKSLSPADKKVNLVQWPGDTSPFEAAIAATREEGALNINGGDSRFDGEFPSYSFVAPIGMHIGKETQIFSSNSNEETYTDDWSGRFYGFRYLRATIEHTEIPIRVSPFNIYFHMFSGEKLASLNAVKENLEYARKQDIIPMTAGEYAAIAEGFYTTEIIPVGRLAWEVRNRGNLETIRFDGGDGLNVDFIASRGILGQRLYQHSLYVSLDPTSQDIYLVLKDKKDKMPNKGLYLIASSLKISSLRHNDNGVVFDASGYGTDNMMWQGVANAEYTVSTQLDGKTTEDRIKATDKGIINIIILPPPSPATSLQIAIRRKTGAI